ncbi:MAG: hypothetical protein O3A85_06100 [Proteobacteria bacterium]|nr:hypothetical protein [Pseudomonadota bacterium]
MMIKSGGPAPPRPRPEKAAWVTPVATSNQISWFGARLRMATTHCRIVDAVLGLVGRYPYPSKRGGMRI